MKEHQLIEFLGFYRPDKAFTPHPAQTIKYYRTIKSTYFIATLEVRRVKIVRKRLLSSFQRCFNGKSSPHKMTGSPALFLRRGPKSTQIISIATRPTIGTSRPFTSTGVPDGAARADNHRHSPSRLRQDGYHVAYPVLHNQQVRFHRHHWIQVASDITGHSQNRHRWSDLPAARRHKE